MTSAKVFAAPKVGVRSTSRRGAVVVRAEKISHGKGGEEGGAVLNNDAFGMVAKVASYSMFATAAQKVRRPGPHRRIRPRASRVPSHRRVAPTSPIAVARGTGKNRHRDDDDCSRGNRRGEERPERARRDLRDRAATPRDRASRESRERSRLRRPRRTGGLLPHPRARPASGVNRRVFPVHIPMPSNSRIPGLTRPTRNRPDMAKSADQDHGILPPLSSSFSPASARPSSPPAPSPSSP
jgi:hypothetical protein